MKLKSYKIQRNKITQFILFIFIFSNQSHATPGWKGGRSKPPDCKHTSSDGSSVPSTSYNIASDVTCAPVPPSACAYGVCSPARCVAANGWCVPKFIDMPLPKFNLNPPILPHYPGSFHNVALVELDHIGVDPAGNALKRIATYTDPTIKSCPKPDGSGSYDVKGGETICDVGIMKGMKHTEIEDPDVLTLITSMDRPVYAKCRYFDPDCSTCCTSWVPATCCPPPPPPPPPT